MKKAMALVLSLILVFSMATLVSAEEKNVAKGYEILLNELRMYNPELLVKDRVLAVTKCDIIDSKKAARIEAALPTDSPHVMISSVSGMGLDNLKDELWKALQKPSDE